MIGHCYCLDLLALGYIIFYVQSLVNFVIVANAIVHNCVFLAKCVTNLLSTFLYAKCMASIRVLNCI